MWRRDTAGLLKDRRVPKEAYGAAIVVIVYVPDKKHFEIPAVTVLVPPISATATFGFGFRHSDKKSLAGPQAKPQAK